MTSAISPEAARRAVELLERIRERGHPFGGIDSEIDALLRDLEPDPVKDAIGKMDTFFSSDPAPCFTNDYNNAYPAWQTLRARLASPPEVDERAISDDERACVVAEVNQMLRLGHPSVWSFVADKVANIGRRYGAAAPRETINRLTGPELAALVQRERDDEARLCGMEARSFGCTNAAAAIERHEHRDRPSEGRTTGAV